MPPITTPVGSTCAHTGSNGSSLSDRVNATGCLWSANSWTMDLAHSR